MSIALKTFKYTGKNRRGRKIRGEIAERNIAEAKTYLKEQGINVINIRTKSSSFSFGGGINGQDISIFARQLATMMKAGIPLVQSFSMVSDNIEKPKMKELIIKIKYDVEGGSTFSDALRRHPLYFDNLFCSLIEAGEKSGALESMLERIAAYKEKSEILKLKIKKAVKYPIAVILAAVIVTAILMIKVIPIFKELFESFGAELPAYTQMVVDMSTFVKTYWIYGVLIVAAIVFAVRQTHRRNKNFRDTVDRIALRTPIFGQIIYKSIIARFSRTLATTFAAGVPLVEALQAAGKATGNIVYEETIDDIRDDVISGQTLNFAMRNSAQFPNMAAQMVAIGEESGAMDEMLDKVATYYEAEVDNAVDGLTAMLEPLIMSILGILVGGLVVAMYLPIFMMGSVV